MVGLQPLGYNTLGWLVLGWLREPYPLHASENHQQFGDMLEQFGNQIHGFGVMYSRNCWITSYSVSV